MILNTPELDSIKKTEQAKQILKAFGNDDDSRFFLIGCGTAEECEKTLSQLFNLDGV